MVGRDADLRRLTELLASPQPQVAIVAGEPGIGKTRLVQEVVAGLPAGAVTLAGQADPGALGRPFELLLDAVDGAAADGGLLSTLSDPGRGLLERLHAGLEIVAALAGAGPAVVVFEDLHWADPESVA